MGGADRIIRIVIALVISGLYFGGIITGTLGTILLVAGGIFLATGFVSFCPLYALFGASTCKVKEA